ncbi:MAG TPA: hypothetical protein H9699_01455 [Candidatus Gemmiger stercoravium]|uniref:hypothetical protein n=1 Tax=uncultured Subdoligranulum sp. TaxID=512298 RepID=UPI001F9E2D8B|nr:hypothetical protein [uncultured Subdoligranulum sp.]HJC53906.1 hypothetical protein [Candidatus Gemmiger stercoravium]
MKLTKRIGVAALALVLALSLTACSPKDMLGNMILGVADLFGLRSESSNDDEAEETVATPGGSISFPEGMDTQSRFPTMVSGDTLYIAFNGISNRSTDYFVAASDTVTLTAYATTESATILEFKAALWELSDDQTKTSYLQGSTVYFPTGGECSTYTVSGLTPGKMYKVTVSYDSVSYYITGGMTVTGVGSEQLTSLSDDTTGDGSDA